MTCYSLHSSQIGKTLSDILNKKWKSTKYSTFSREKYSYNGTCVRGGV